ncbi:MAG: hypothetical protein GVY32_12245 [Gammaproteobacteria bacterium]|jgi:hypothetical protein|nr:hypothetical protein [Gammaproteobacteria bacterium]
MKIVLSRKGFDSSAGGVPSPILPDGRLVSLPIPDPRSPLRYGEIGGEAREIGALVSNLTGGRIRRSSRAHLDPDLVAADRPRPSGWRGVFGQEAAAQGHLRNEGVGPGDLFVFFGVFQRVRYRRGRYSFDRDAPRIHVVWGWMQVERVVAVADCPPPIRRRIGDHPHFHHNAGPDNVLYLARRRLALPEPGAGTLPGSGVFARYHPLLQLTDPRAAGPSLWRLPAWLRPGEDRRALSYHRKPARWSVAGGRLRLESASRGQEFVLDARDYPRALPFLAALLKRLG